MIEMYASGCSIYYDMNQNISSYQSNYENQYCVLGASQNSSRCKEVIGIPPLMVELCPTMRNFGALKSYFFRL